MTRATAHIGTVDFATTIEVAGRTITADEPADNGGQDAGLAPYDLLTASLSACTAITLRMYAERKQIPVERIGVSLRMRKLEGEEVTEMSREITLEGNLSQEDRDRLLAIAERCPVHRALTHEIRIVSALANPD